MLSQSPQVVILLAFLLRAWYRRSLPAPFGTRPGVVFHIVIRYPGLSFKVATMPRSLIDLRATEQVPYPVVMIIPPTCMDFYACAIDSLEELACPH